MQVKQIIEFTHKSIKPNLDITNIGVFASLDAIAESVFEQHNSGFSLDGTKMPDYSKYTIKKKAKALGVSESSIKPNLNWSGNLHYLAGNRGYNYSLQRRPTFQKVSLDFVTPYTRKAHLLRFEDWSGILDVRVSNSILRKLQMYDINSMFNIDWRKK